MAASLAATSGVQNKEVLLICLMKIAPNRHAAGTSSMWTNGHWQCVDEQHLNGNDLPAQWVKSLLLHHLINQLKSFCYGI
jgi:hypothetical protein